MRATFMFTQAVVTHYADTQIHANSQFGGLAHVDAVKASLTKRLLHAGVIGEIGSVDDGNTQTDSLALNGGAASPSNPPSFLPRLATPRSTHEISQSETVTMLEDSRRVRQGRHRTG
jgi:hypothetical protein